MEKKFELISKFKPTGDQPTAIKQLTDGILNQEKFQILLGATGTGKTFTLANVIKNVNKPTLIIEPNKTLAGQIYEEMKSLFPNNRVEYFISNFDFYQPEAYVVNTDTFISKTALMNQEIEAMRTSAINSILERRDTIIIASVASIYGLTDPNEYRSLVFNIVENEYIDRKKLFSRLIESQYKKNQFDFTPATFRVNGDVIDIFPVNFHDEFIRIYTFDDIVEKISRVSLITNKVIENYKTFAIYPAYDHVSSFEKVSKICADILKELDDRIYYFKKNKLFLEAERIENRTRQDVDSLKEFGICPGIENYARYIDNRKSGDKPFCLIDYFPKDYLLILDESHIMIPQLNGMYNGDRSRKETLVKYGFRLPSALDNRPLNFKEFESLINQVIFMSATPGDYELQLTNNKYIQQIIRPTGLLDPVIEVRDSINQVDDLIFEINKRVKNHERVMVVTLTINMAENLTKYFKEKGIKTVYLHSECKTLERSEIIYKLRKGVYDVLIGINLLREGLDIPEVSLIAILDADKEGFLRNHRSLIQIVGRCARNKNGLAIMYASTITKSMKTCIDETSRRRLIQNNYNEENGIIPTTIEREIKKPITNISKKDKNINYKQKFNNSNKEKLLKEIELEMKKAANNFDFERAIELRDILFELKNE